MENECSIVRDLLPLYAEGLTNPETTSFIEAHLKQCKDCRKEYEMLKSGAAEQEALPAKEKAALDEVAEFSSFLKKYYRRRTAWAIAIYTVFFISVAYFLFGPLRFIDSVLPGKQEKAQKAAEQYIEEYGSSTRQQMKIKIYSQGPMYGDPDKQSVPVTTDIKADIDRAGKTAVFLVESAGASQDEAFAETVSFSIREGTLTVQKRDADGNIVEEYSDHEKAAAFEALLFDHNIDINKSETSYFSRNDLKNNLYQMDKIIDLSPGFEKICEVLGINDVNFTERVSIGFRFDGDSVSSMSINVNEDANRKSFIMEIFKYILGDMHRDISAEYTHIQVYLN